MDCSELELELGVVLLLTIDASHLIVTLFYTNIVTWSAVVHSSMCDWKVLAGILRRQTKARGM